MNSALDLAFNEAVITMAKLTCPRGYDVLSSADYLTRFDGTLEGLREGVRDHGRMVVEAGNSGRTIFDDEEVNHAFRAWHDACHLQGNFAFDLAGEIRASDLMQAQLIHRYGATKARPWCLYIEADVVGQTLFHMMHGYFPPDQKAFVRAYMVHALKTNF